MSAIPRYVGHRYNDEDDYLPPTGGTWRKQEIGCHPDEAYGGHVKAWRSAAARSDDESARAELIFGSGRNSPLDTGKLLAGNCTQGFQRKEGVEPGEFSLAVHHVM